MPTKKKINKPKEKASNKEHAIYVIQEISKLLYMLKGYVAKLDDK
jgi:hypothetical protein